MNCRLITPLLLLFCHLGVMPLSAGAEDFEGQFDAFSRETATTFERFSRDNEAAFNDAFVAQWQRFNRALTEPAPAMPKPRLQPGRDTARPTHSQGSAAPAASPEPFQTPPDGDGFYGHPMLSLPLYQLPRLQGLAPEKLLAFRQQALGSDDFRELIQLLGFMQQRLNADSYTTLALARRLCGQYYADRNNPLACSWVLGQTRGLDVRLGARQQQLLLLTPSAQQWYEQSFFDVDGLRLYVINDDQFKTLSGHTALQTARHEDATTATRVTLSDSFTPARVNMVPAKHFGLPLQLDQDFVAWLHQLPLLTVKDYLADPVPTYLRQQLQEAFAGTGGSITAFNAVLADLQNWPYMIDEEQFGGEKPLTLSESLYFPYSDCEDRVYALAAISRTFLQLPVAALRYPNHLSAAVQLDQDWQEADPTYVGATLGMRQPPYRGMEPEWFYP